MSLKATLGAQVSKATVDSKVVGAYEETCLCVDISARSVGSRVWSSGVLRVDDRVELTVLEEKGLPHTSMQCTMMYRDQPLPRYKIAASDMENLQIRDSRNYIVLNGLSSI